VKLANKMPLTPYRIVKNQRIGRRPL